jgi:CBS domain-containing protein
MEASQTEEKAQADTEEKTETEGEPQAEGDANTESVEDKDKAEAQAEAAVEAESEGQEKAEVETKSEGEEKVKAESEAKAEPTEETKSESQEKAEKDTKAEDAEDRYKPEAEVGVEAEEKADTEAVEEKPEDKAESTGESKTEGEAKASGDANEGAEEKVETENETKTEEKAESKDETEAPDQNEESAKGVVSETIQKMTESPAELPGKPGKPATAGRATLNNIGVSSEVCARDIMQKEVVWGNPEDSVQQALTKMQQHDSGYIMIGWDEALEGIVSRSDIAGAMSIYLRPIFAKWHRPIDEATLQIKLKWIMSRPVRTIKPETPLATIMENICRFGGRGLPVVDEQGKVQGLVTVFDVFRTLLNTNKDFSTVGKTAETPAME